MSKFKTGDKVRYIGEDHKVMPKFYPPVGTIGTVINQSNEYDDVYVHWEKGSTSKEDCWYCDRNDIELAEDTDMTNEEIWEMVKPKMEKNGLKPIGTCTKWNGCVPEYFYTYSEDDVHNAIAIAYRSGYERAMKGRPFKFGEKKEKKKGGHWEPVDPKNLPKEGTRARYTRECRDYKNKITLGRTGVVRMEGPEHNWFGISLDDYQGMYYNWLSFDGLTAKSLDMWVEDDE